MSRTAQTNNILAGAFLLCGVALAILISFVLSGASDALTPTRTYVVLFSLADGATGVKPGSAVLLGGQPVGKVKSVEVLPDATDGQEAGVAVTIRVHTKFKFLANAVFFLERPLLGSFSSINVTSLGDPTKAGALPLADNGRIRGQLAPPAFLAQAGFGPDQAAEVRAIITDTRKAVAKLSEIADKGAPRIDAALNDATGAITEIRQKLPEWSARVDRITQNLDSAIAKAENASAKFDPIVKNVADGVDQAREVIAKADTIMGESRPKILGILDSVDSASRKIDSQSVDQANLALGDARKALDTITSAAASAAALLREEIPNIRRAMANVRLVTDQMKLAAVEIRSQPWRVFYTPSEKENETSVLYDSARSYAQAVSDLRAASESLEATLGAISAGSASPGSVNLGQLTDRETIDHLNSQLKQAFDKYRNAEKALLDRLIQHAGNSADMHHTASGAEKNAPAEQPEPPRR